MSDGQESSVTASKPEKESVLGRQDVLGLKVKDDTIRYDRKV